MDKVSHPQDATTKGSLRNAALDRLAEAIKSLSHDRNKEIEDKFEEEKELE